MKKRTKILISISSGVLAAIIVVIGIFIKQKTEKLPQDASFMGNDLSNKNYDEVDKITKEKINSVFKNKKIKLKINNKIYSMDVSAINLHYDTGDIFKNAKKSQDKDKELPPIKYDKGKLEKFLKQLAGKSKKPPTKFSNKISGNKLLVKAGSPGSEIVVEDALLKIDKNLKNLKFEIITPKMKEIISKDSYINLEKVKKEIDREAKDATFKIAGGKRVYTDEIVGLNLDLNKAKTIVSNPKTGQYEIPLTTTNPKITKASLIESHKHPNTSYTLSSYTTYFKPGADKLGKNRDENIRIAARAINGIILLPGEEFSFGATAGKAPGYLEAVTYENGKKSTGIGGGMCQVSSTLFNAAIRAGLEITQKIPHSRLANYVPHGFDATYNKGSADFKFKNNAENPIMIHAATTANSITTNIMGIKNPNETLHVSTESKILEKTPTKIKAVGIVKTTRNGVTKIDKYPATYNTSPN